MIKKSIESTGKTVEEAIRRGLEELKISRDQVKTTIIEEPSKGMFGILSSKVAKVKLTINKEINKEIADNTLDNAKRIISNILEKAEIKAEIEGQISNESVNIKIKSEEAGKIIGYKGETLDSIQLLTNIIISNNTEEEAVKVVIDINDYREKRKQTLINLANKMVENVKRFKKIIKLEPMSAYERMIVHTVVQEHPEVVSESQGEEPRRRVIIKLK